MGQIKLKEMTEVSLDELEKEINAYLETSEAQNYQVLNITVNNNVEHKFASKEDEFTAILTLLKKD
ncbi:hypothetical protein [Staphylococcus nepalensis]|uniref:hypothetical protein n=1 Tax=Staphylococcus nepalensis TaxID=214473 RepID=UPI0023005F83|nr:hypothetical protein [Staphylococcus nepalensis]